MRILVGVTHVRKHPRAKAWNRVQVVTFDTYTVTLRNTETDRESRYDRLWFEATYRPAEDEPSEEPTPAVGDVAMWLITFCGGTDTWSDPAARRRYRRLARELLSIPALRGLCVRPADLRVRDLARRRP